MWSRLLFIGGFVLALGLVAGYAAHDLFSPDSTTEDNTLPNGSVSGLEVALEHDAQNQFTQQVPAAGSQQNTKREIRSRDWRQADSYEHSPGHLAVLEELLEERTANIDLYIGSIIDNPELEAADPNLVSELLAEHEYAYNEQMQLIDEVPIHLFPPSGELDEDELEEANLAGMPDNPPDIAEQEMEEMSGAGEQEPGYQELEHILPPEDYTPTSE